MLIFSLPEIFCLHYTAGTLQLDFDFSVVPIRLIFLPEKAKDHQGEQAEMLRGAGQNAL